MKKKLSLIKGSVAFVFLMLAFIACDKDYTTLGTDIIGDNNYQSQKVTYPVVTYNKKLNPVQTNSLPSYYLGVYNDPVFGSTSSSILSQLQINGGLTGVNKQLDSVMLTIPFFSRLDVNDPIDENGAANISLDSIYGNVDETGNSLLPMRLSIYRSSYYLGDFDPDTNFENPQKYFSDGSVSFGNLIPESELESELIFESQSGSLFQFRSNQIIFTEENDEGEMEETERIQPSLVLVFKDESSLNDGYYYSNNLQFWEETIFSKFGEPELSNVNNFRDYFRGIYIKLEEAVGEGAMALTNINASNIRFYYRSISDSDVDEDGIPDNYDADVDDDGVLDEGKLDSDGDGITDTADIDQTGGLDLDGDGFDDAVVSYANREVTLNFSGNTINLFENNFNPEVLSAVNSADEVNGDSKLYLKGGEGSIAIIDLFPSLDDLESLKNLYKDEDGNYLRLINEANLIFYEDETIITDEEANEKHNYDRLYVHDLKNNTPLVDFQRDAIISSSPINSVVNHLGKRYEDELGRKKFKIKITEHLKNIIYEDSTNTKLGLSITSNVNLIDNSSVLVATPDEELTKVSRGTVLSQRGTVLYGNNTTEDKQVKLEIFYTEPE